MEKMKEKLKELLGRYTLTIALGCVITYLIIDRYFYEQVVLYTALFGVAAVALFLLFDQLRKHKFLGPLIYIGLLVGVYFLSSNSLYSGWRSSGVIPTDWFYLQRVDTGFVFEYFLALYVFGGFFLISILYYFTQVRFRSLGLMLCLLFPFVIYAKRADVMSPFQVTLIITLFLAIVVHNRQQQSISDGVRAVHDMAYYVSLALFASLAGAVCMLIPLPEAKSVLERDSHAFDVMVNNRNSSSDYSGYSRTSSPRYGASYTNEIIFYCDTTDDQDVYYLKRQAYDTFEKDVWTTDYSSVKFSDYSYYHKVNINRDEYYGYFKTVADRELLTESLNVPEYSLEEFHVHDDDFRGMYVPVPPGVIGRDYSYAASDGYYTYGDGETSVGNNGDTDRDYDYTVYFYPEKEEDHRFAASLRLTGQQYYDMLKKARRHGIAESEPLIEQYEMALSSYTGSVECSDRMKELAFEITKDCKSDYEKAVAFVNYFEQNDYVYDLEYTPTDTSLDYFLFESKTGSCTSYATSMAIMARIVGLPARYVEGFVAYERDESDSDSFVVRDAHAHAYVEVFIPGAGWLTFDPTVEGYMSISAATGNGLSIGTVFRYLSRIIIFLAVVLFIVLIILLDRIIERVFRIRLHFTKGDQRITRLYLRTVKHLSKRTETDLSAYTVDMIVNIAAERAGVDVAPIAKLFEKTTFGLIPLEDAEFAAAYEHYKLVYKQLRQSKKKKQKPESAPA